VFAPVSYLESIGLLERMVQLVISLLRKWYANTDASLYRSWTNALGYITLAANTRFIKLYGFTPVELMLRFLPYSRNIMPSPPPHNIVDFNTTPMSLQ